MRALPISRMEIEQPLYVISTVNRYPSGSMLSVDIFRMDGLPEHGPCGTRFRADRENWLTHRQAAALIEALICGLPVYSSPHLR